MIRILLSIVFLAATCSTFSQKLEWANTSERITPMAVFADPQGNTFAGGIFTGTLDFDWGPGTTELSSGSGSSGSEGAYITKADGDGNFVWAKAIQGPINSGISAIETDGASNIYVTGFIRGTADLDPGPEEFIITTSYPYFNATFVLKLDPAGNFLWVRQFNNLYEGTVRTAMVIGDSGEIYCAGVFEGTVDFDPGPEVYMLTTTSFFSAFTVSLDTDGNFRWANYFGGVSAARSIRHLNGNLYIAGDFMSETLILTGTAVTQLTSAGGVDGLLVKMNTNGEGIWARQIGGTGDDYIRDAAPRADGDIFITGQFANVAEFNFNGASKKLTATGEIDMFIAHLDPGGNTIWVKQVAGAQQALGTAIFVSASDHLYVQGQYSQQATIMIGTTPKTLSGGGMFMMQMSTAGDKLGWTFRYPVNNLYTFVRNDDIYSYGFFFQSFDADPGLGTLTLTAQPYGSAFVAKHSGVDPVDGGVTGIGEHSSTEFNIYPNPVSAYASVEYDVKDVKYTVRLKDLNNRVVREYRFSSITANNIDLSELTQGLYLAELTDEEGKIIVRKVVKY